MYEALRQRVQRGGDYRYRATVMYIGFYRSYMASLGVNHLVGFRCQRGASYGCTLYLAA